MHVSVEWSLFLNRNPGGYLVMIHDGMCILQREAFVKLFFSECCETSLGEWTVVCLSVCLFVLVMVVVENSGEIYFLEILPSDGK